MDKAHKKTKHHKKSPKTEKAEPLFEYDVRKFFLIHSDLDGQLDRPIWRNLQKWWRKIEPAMILYGFDEAGFMYIYSFGRFGVVAMIDDSGCEIMQPRDLNYSVLDEFKKYKKHRLPKYMFSRILSTEWFYQIEQNRSDINQIFQFTPSLQTEEALIFIAGLFYDYKIAHSC